MDLVADILLAIGALGAALYCAVLARRLSRFTDLEKGMGGAIAVLSVQVDDMTKALGGAQVSALSSREDLNALVERAETASRHLEMMLASMHDLPDPSPKPQPAEHIVDIPNSESLAESQFQSRPPSFIRPTVKPQQSGEQPPQWRRRHLGVAAE